MPKAKFYKTLMIESAILVFEKYGLFEKIEKAAREMKGSISLDNLSDEEKNELKQAAHLLEFAIDEWNDIPFGQEETKPVFKIFWDREAFSN